ncbi:helix-turn-helix domain-containing protein [Candidatus Woesearchaeota archaeon]|nr:helix-turn-helix domain-containing protein [Candidatus Woesearchaeota archaeon]
MGRKLSVEKKETIKRLYESGLSVADIAKKTGTYYQLVYSHTRLAERGFSSPSDYQSHLAESRGLSPAGYKEHLAKERHFISAREYNAHLARKKGYLSLWEYEKHLEGLRQRQPTNKKLRAVVAERLAELGKTQKWLAEKLGIGESAVSRYSSGKTRPRKDLQAKLFKSLELPYKTIDDMV